MQSHLRSVAAVAVGAFGLLTGCGDSTPPEFTRTPSVQQNPNPAVPMAAIVSAATDEPSQLLVEVSDGETSWTIPTPEQLSTEHEVAVLGFHPGRKHTISVDARDQHGNQTQAPTTLEFEVSPLPDDFPPIKVTTSVAESMEPGVTLFALMKWPDGGPPPDLSYGLAVAVDQRGEVIWYYRTDELLEDPQRLENGNLLYMLGNHRLEEVDMLGNVVASWHASKHPNPEANKHVRQDSIPVAIETIHHDVRQLPNGNFLTLGTELIQIDDYPTDVMKPAGPKARANVIADTVVEFTREGSIVKEWKLAEMLDVRRLGYESLTGIWDQWAYVNVEGGTKDWSHSNALFHDASDDSILVSVRHQEAVVKFSRQTGELIWILGTPDGWGDRWKPFLLTPKGDFEWQYHQHAVEVTDRGTLLLFDNGNYRAIPPGKKMDVGESYSRAVEYAIDAKAMTVEQVWRYGGKGQEHFYSPFISEADPLPKTGNILITDGGRIRDKQGRQSELIMGDRHWARVIEVTHADPPEKVFELTVDTGLDGSMGWAIYRSDRWAGLYADQPRQ